MHHSCAIPFKPTKLLQRADTLSEWKDLLPGRWFKSPCTTKSLKTPEERKYKTVPVSEKPLLKPKETDQLTVMTATKPIKVSTPAFLLLHGF